MEVKVGASGAEAEAALNSVRTLSGNYLDIQNDSVGSQVGSELKSRGLKAIIFRLTWDYYLYLFRFELLCDGGNCSIGS